MIQQLSFGSRLHGTGKGKVRPWISEVLTAQPIRDFIIASNSTNSISPDLSSAFVAQEVWFSWACLQVGMEANCWQGSKSNFWKCLSQDAAHLRTLSPQCPAVLTMMETSVVRLNFCPVTNIFCRLPRPWHSSLSARYMVFARTGGK